jgi:hypothetical protein
MTKKYKAEGSSGCTYGLEVQESYYIQIHLPNGDFGSIQEIEKEGRFGWDYWIGKFSPKEIESFPENCQLDSKI